ncbi:hypothetical protein [Oligoflexus tunisiensis]|uniref:hypothetical protein n=1 Tax=Oligoflexus tunisiensis TaxID=708132 RepID=UPI001C40238F|nr:hypothetical protein [Oligoflexus tunisiensis]
MDAVRSAVLGNSLKFFDRFTRSKSAVIRPSRRASLKEALILNQICVGYQQETVLFDEKFCENRPTAKTARKLA